MFDNEDEDVNLDLGDNNEPDEDELDISFEGEEENEDSDKEPKDSPAIQALRKELREKNKLLADAAKYKPQQEELTLGTEPSLDDPEIDFDPDKFKAALKKHYETAAEIERRKQAAIDATQNVTADQAKQLTQYQDQIKALGIANHKKYENQFLADTKGFEGQASVILKAAKDKALIVYVLGSKPDKLDALLDIKDDIELAAEVARIERGIKVNKKQSTFKPEQTVRGNALGSSSTGKVDKQLERLEKEAAQTGDRTKVIQYKRSLNK